MYKKFLKRFFDIIISLVALILFSPVFLIVLVLLYISNDGKPFFFQQRPGWKAKPFYVIKFKTMNDKKGKDGKLLPDKQRITSLGRFIRSTSLDEIPQLINVFKGDMSLIGPRPLLMGYIEHYNERQARRHEVRPGISGWAQVNGRNAISWEKKFEFDVWYIEHLSFLLDVKIIYLTIMKVFRKEGINNDAAGTTMPPFRGSNHSLN
jgi:lipopolysaccharide/colanic/teichoic acid biosynthesis glycosyltransferase